jgi:hypothetical protein
VNRSSFVGALVFTALGAVLAFAIQPSLSWLDVRTAGVIIMIAGICDLVIRFAVADSPLLSPQVAEVSALVEPLGEPVLDVFGNPISSVTPPSGAAPVLMDPAVEQVMPMVPAQAQEPEYVEYPAYPEYPAELQAPVQHSYPAQAQQPYPSEEDMREQAIADARARDLARYEQTLAAAGDPTPEPSSVLSSFRRRRNQP